jgi:hypothetical protein
MIHLAKTLFGANFASRREGINLSDLLAEECAMNEETYCQTWWKDHFPGKRGVSVGELLTMANDQNEASEYIRELVFAAVFNKYQKK